MKLFHISPVPETGCPMGHTGLTIDHWPFSMSVNCLWDLPKHANNAKQKIVIQKEKTGNQLWMKMGHHICTIIFWIKRWTAKTHHTTKCWNWVLTALEQEKRPIVSGDAQIMRSWENQSFQQLLHKHCNKGGASNGDTEKWNSQNKYGNISGNVCGQNAICEQNAFWRIFFSSRLFAAIGSQGAVLLVGFQALGLFVYWPVSRCACGREGVRSRPSCTVLEGDWQARAGSCVKGGIAERWTVSVMVVVGGEIFEQQAGRKGGSCRMGEESCPTGNEGRAAGGCLEGGRAGSGSGFGEHADGWQDANTRYKVRR